MGVREARVRSAETMARRTAHPPETGTLDPRLIVVKSDPLNAEAPLAEQCGVITPTPIFYVRSNFGIQHLSAQDWRLYVDGEVEQPCILSYDAVRALPSRTLLVTLECAGNGRAGLTPPAAGEPWQYGAVSTAEWTGVPLGIVLAAAGLTARAREIVIAGVDKGMVATRDGVISFARGMALDRALHPDTLLAYAMNGEPLTAEHGFPLRLIVPGWYGMAAVKWVTRIDAIAGAFDGYYQTERYVMAHPERGETETVPLTTMGVRSLITAPARDTVLARGPYRMRGMAWSGQAPISRVEVSVDGGVSWAEAELASRAEPYAWRRWEYLWQAAPGAAALCSRAFDDAGRTQPVAPEWNALGYANNAIQAVAVTVA